MLHRDKRLLDVRGLPCQRCGVDDGTVVAAHYQGIGAGRLGKGRGIKPHDFCTAPLCRACHEIMDSYKHGNDYERATEFLLLILESLRKRVFTDRKEFKT